MLSAMTSPLPSSEFRRPNTAPSISNICPISDDELGRLRQLFKRASWSGVHISMSIDILSVVFINYHNKEGAVSASAQPTVSAFGPQRNPLTSLRRLPDNCR